MEYPFAADRNWRTAALVAATVAAVELLVIAVIGIAVFAWPYVHDGQARAETPAPAAATHAAHKGSLSRPAGAATLPRSHTSVVVMNGNGISGAADEVSSRVRRLHYVITGVTNAPRSDFARTLVMYRPGFKGAAVRFAKDVGAKRVAPLDGIRPAGLMGAQLALIIGRR